MTAGRKSFADAHLIREAARYLWNLRRVAGFAAMAAAFAVLSTIVQGRIAGCWQVMARAAQLRPSDCAPIWVLCWGRGAGKTHTGSEHTLDMCEDWGPALEGALISKTVADVKSTMIGGSSGLLACARRRGYTVRYVAGDKKVYHPSGAFLHVMSAEQTDMGRGPNLNYFWADEIAAWGHDSLEIFKVMLMGWRAPSPLGKKVQRAIITTTPKPNAITRYLLRDKAMKHLITVTRQHTLDNTTINPDQLMGAFGGTRLGLQELSGVLLDSANLLTPEIIERHRVSHLPEDIREVVVAVDPSIDIKDTSDACGIVAMVKDSRPLAHCYVKEALTLQGASWAGWAQATIECAIRNGAKRVIAETNQGGHGVIEILQGAIETLQEAQDDAYATAIEAGEYPEEPEHIDIEITGVWHKAGKRARAEPICAKAEQGRVHFVNSWPGLEEELCTWVEGAKSPNAMDAFAMAGNALLFPDDDGAPDIGWTPNYLE